MSRTPADPTSELVEAADIIARMEGLLVAQMKARGHDGSARIYRDSTGRWTVRLTAEAGEPFTSAFGEHRNYAFGFGDDLVVAFREALKQAHAMENPADYSAWFTEERLCDDCNEAPATLVNDNEGWMADDRLCENCAERRFDRATERAMEG